jgi:hypothetical protein
MEYNTLDFSKWEDESTFNVKFAKLLSGLDQPSQFILSPPTPSTSPTARLYQTL